MRKLAWFAVFFAAAALFILWLPPETRSLPWIAPAVTLTSALLTLAQPWRGKRTVLFLRTALLGFAVGCLYVLLWQSAVQRELDSLLAGEQTVEQGGFTGSRYARKTGDFAGQFGPEIAGQFFQA